MKSLVRTIAATVAIALSLAGIATLARTACFVVSGEVALFCTDNAVMNPMAGGSEPDTMMGDGSMRLLDEVRLAQNSMMTAGPVLKLYELLPAKTRGPMGVVVMPASSKDPGLWVGFPGTGVPDGAVMDVRAGSGPSLPAIRFKHVQPRMGGPVMVAVSIVGNPSGIATLELWRSGNRVSTGTLWPGATGMFTGAWPARISVSPTSEGAMWRFSYGASGTALSRANCGGSSSATFDEIRVLMPKVGLDKPVFTVHCEQMARLVLRGILMPGGV